MPCVSEGTHGPLVRRCSRECSCPSTPARGRAGKLPVGPSAATFPTITTLSRLQLLTGFIAATFVRPVILPRAMNAGQHNPRPYALTKHCPVCSQENTAMARYCARCGTALPVARTAPVGDELRNFALIVAALAVVVTTVVAFRMAAGSSRYERIVTSGPTIRRDFQLSNAKADAMHALIAPADVRVIVGRRKGGILLKGTSGELDILDRFVELVTRLDGLDAAEMNAAMARARRTWTTTATYRLASGHARALWRILAFDDVPVLVSGGTSKIWVWGRKSKIRVEAAPEDQEIVRGVVNILHGERQY